LFTVKMTVDPAFFKPGRLHEIGESSTLVPSLIKERCCLTDYFLSRLLAFSHVVF